MARRPAFPTLLPLFGRAVTRTNRQLGRIGREMVRSTLQAGTQALVDVSQASAVRRRSAAGAGDWIAGAAFGPAGMRRYRLFRPAGVATSERLPLLVMLHGCAQDADGFALSTRMNRLAARERFLVLYPEQDRIANPQGCWNWYDTRSGRAFAEAATVLAAIDQVSRLYPADSGRVALAGLSAGASLGALIAMRHPERFRAVVMHSGVSPGTASSTAQALSAMRGWRVVGAPPSQAPLPPLLVIHGSRDPVVASANARQAAEWWAAGSNAAESPPRAVQRGQRRGMTVTDFKARGRTAATLCEIDGLGHAWSGGDGRHPFGDADGPDASRLAWAFVLRQLRRLERSGARRCGA